MSETPDPTAAPMSARAAREAERRRLKTEMIARIAAGEPVMAAADAAGIGWRRAYVWRADDPEFRAAWDRARAQVAARPTITPYPVPASPRPAPPEPIDVPPSPARVAPAPYIWRVDVPGNGFTDYDPEAAEAGDRVVCILWSFSREVPDTVVTYTVRDDGTWTKDAMPDLEAYEAVKPDESERPVVEPPRSFGQTS